MKGAVGLLMVAVIADDNSFRRDASRRAAGVAEDAAAASGKVAHAPSRAPSRGGRGGCGGAGFARRLRGFLAYVLWTWGLAFALSLANGGYLWRRHAQVRVLAPVVDAGFLTVGAAAYLGIRAGREGKSDPPAGFPARAARAVALLSCAEAITGLLFATAMAAYAALCGSGGRRSGVAAGAAIFGGVMAALLFSLLAGLVPCGVAWALGMVAGANLSKAPIQSGQLWAARHDAGGLRVAAAVGVFAALNATALLWESHVPGSGATVTAKQGLALLLRGALEAMMVGEMWACAVVLWFLWLRRTAGAPFWWRGLAVLPTLGVVALAAWFSL